MLHTWRGAPTACRMIKNARNAPASVVATMRKPKAAVAVGNANVFRVSVSANVPLATLAHDAPLSLRYTCTAHAVTAQSRAKDCHHVLHDRWEHANCSMQHHVRSVPACSHAGDWRELPQAALQY